MNILLTGSGGFIGKNLKSYLQNRYNLFTPRSYELDLTDEAQVSKYFSENDINFIIHCGSTGGARGIQDKDTTVEDNLAMVDNILKYKNVNARVILFGSGAMYDKSRPLHKIKENQIGKFIPSDLYGKSKMLLAEKIKNRKDVLCLNIFACYGYGEKENRFPSYAITSVLDGNAIEINQNVVNIINITPTESISLYDIANIVNKISGKKVEIIIKNPVMNNEYTGDNFLLLKNYPQLKFTTMEEGLTKLHNYIKHSMSVI